MTATMLALLTLQIVFGALDNILHHEITERLPSKPSARYELALHSAREGIYGCLFLIFAWTEPAGFFAALVLVLLATEIVVTILDFLEEDRSRHLPPFERVLHTVLAIFYGGFLISVIPWLAASAMSASQINFVDHGALSWFFTVSSIGVFAFSVRNFIAVRVLGKQATRQHLVQPQSGRTVLVTGGTGFVGSALVARLETRGDRVFVLSRDVRQAKVLLGANVRHLASLSELPAETRIDAVVNLAGAPIIGLPWTASRRRAIWRSRIETTDALVDWMKTLEQKPRVLVSGSAVGYYGDRADEALSDDENRGRGFAAELCAAWEEAAMGARDLGIRVVCLRLGLVLDLDGGALPMMALPCRFGLGAIFGNGQQWMSWITRNDLLRMIVTAIDSDKWQGAINAVAPEPVRHADFQKSMARSLRRPLYFRVPAWALRLGMGEMSSIFLYSQRVVPDSARNLGFAFDVHWAADALELIIGAQSVECAMPKQSLQTARPIGDNPVIQHSQTGLQDDDHTSRLAPVPIRAQGAGGACGKAA
ncbi:MAG: TIGR01777 family oxidoreductase [Micropepsaceae bacterium]